MTLRGFIKKVLRRLRHELSKPIGYGLEYVIRFFNLQYMGQRFAPIVPAYYSAIPDAADLGGHYWQTKTALPGITIDDAAIMAHTRDLMGRYGAEFRATFPLHKDSKSPFHLINGSYMAGDAQYYYALLRAIKPRRIIEIGSGNSTLVADRAIARNKEDDAAYHCRMTAIEPYPDARLEACNPAAVHVLAKKLQDVDLSLFDELGDGDILFIDSSHVLREGSDVRMEFLEVLPRLKKGVHVHVHDISLPKPYPKVYFDNHLYWNEQYLLQAYLIHNDHVRITWPGTYLWEAHQAEMLALFPEILEMRKPFPMAEPSAFWFQIVKDAA